MQLFQLRRTHVLPDDEPSLRRLGRSMGLMKDPVSELDKQWRQHSKEVRRLHEKLFYRPLLAAVAKLPGDEARLTPKAAEQRLAALGYDDPVAALRHLEALTSGVSRTASIQRTLLPAMLEWFADAPEPRRRACSASAGSPRRSARRTGTSRRCATRARSPQRLALMLASSRYATDLLQRAPEGVKMLGDADGLAPRSREALEKEMVGAGRRHTDPVEAITAVRAPAAASCSGSRWRTCSASSTRPRSATPSPT